jgi:hypothetical protein
MHSRKQNKGKEKEEEATGSLSCTADAVACAVFLSLLNEGVPNPGTSGTSPMSCLLAMSLARNRGVV